MLVEEEIAAQAKARQLAGLKQNTVPDICPERGVQKAEPPERNSEAERENTTNYQLAKMAGDDA